MTGALVAIAVIAGACAYLVGYAFIAPRESFARTPAGGAVIGAGLLIALVGPAWVAAVVPGAPWWFRPGWVATETLGLLAGLRVWRIPSLFRSGRWFSLDESPASRAALGIQLADSLDAALDVLARERIRVHDVERLTPALMRAGSRFWYELPERHGDVYVLVASHVEPQVAAAVTGVLLDGACRRG